jgi:plastocyanin
MNVCSSDSKSSRRSELGSARGALRRVLLGGVAALFAGALTAQTPTEKPALTPELAVMNDLSRRFAQLEALLAAGDAAGFVQEVERSDDIAHRLSGLRPQVAPKVPGDFERHAERLRDLVVESARWAGEGRLMQSRQAFEEARATCVSCHVRFRTDNDRRGYYPAVGSTVTGNVELRDAQGNAREDRSWVLVFLEHQGALAEPAPLRVHPRISQRDRQFQPRVLPVTVGTTVEFPNDDTIFHNVFSLSKTLPFDLGVYEPGRSDSREMVRTGLVKVHCNIHPEMVASIVVLANPWYSLCDRAGDYVITGVPSGAYTLRAWNDMGAETRQEVRLSDGQVLRARIVLEETRRAVEHTNKFGKPYSGKYR